MLFIFEIGMHYISPLFRPVLVLFADSNTSSIIGDTAFLLLGAFGLVCTIVIITIAALAIYIKKRGTYEQLMTRKDILFIDSL